MRITIVTLCDYGMAETFVGAVLGDVTPEDRATMAERFGAVLADDEDEDDEEARVLGFRSVEASESAGALAELLNTDDGSDPWSAAG